MLDGTKNVVISGGVFTQISNQNNGIKLLHDNVAPGAFHDSAERYDPPKCHPGTREAVIKDIMEWMETNDRKEHFLWLYGPAGAGKSAIAQTVAELCSSVGLLGASFFFSRSASGRNDATFLIATLAYQLSISVPEIAELVSLAIDKDPHIFTRTVKVQMESLILQPLSSLCAHQSRAKEEFRPCDKIIIIDGLDECSTGHIQHHILDALASSLQHYPVPLIFLITSRPEQDIRDAFNNDKMDPFTHRIVLDDHYLPDADIRLFLSSEFENIKKCHPLRSHLPTAWPSNLELEELVQRSSGQFIYAATVAKFVQSPRHRPTERLNITLGLSNSGTQTPFSELDALYMHILRSTDNIEKILDVFAFLFLILLQHRPEHGYAWTPAESHTIDSIENFLQYEPGDLQFILADLHSLLFVPLPESRERVLRTYHASLGDFLTDRSRSGIYFIVTPKAFSRMAIHCIHHNSTLLEFKKDQSAQVKIFDDMDSPLRVSFLLFLELCPSADPTPELLEALASFKFDQLLMFDPSRSFYVGSGPWDFIAIHLPGFLKWLHKVCPSPHGKTCLCTRYMACFDAYLNTQLSAYPSTDTEWRSMLTALTLDEPCVFDRGSLRRVILGPSYLDQYTKWLQHIPSEYAISSKYSDFRSTLTAFLVSPTRSGPYCVGKAQYLQLAIKSIEYLHSESMRTERRASFLTPVDPEQCATSVILAILSRFPRDRTLAQSLRTHSVSEDVKEVGEPIYHSAVNAYIQDYESDQVELEHKKPQLEHNKPELESKKRRKWLGLFRS